MTKREFLKALDRLTAGLGENERQRLLDYYGELIDDGMEDGLSEGEAVAALGDPATLAAELDAPARSALPVAKPAPDGDADPDGDAVPDGETVPALEGLRVRVANADVTILRKALSGGAAAQLRFSDPARFAWRMDGGAMEIVEREPEGTRFSVKRVLQLLSSPIQQVTVTLAVPLTGGLEYSAGGGDLRLEGVALEGGARLDAASGDIRIKGAVLGGALKIQCRSGDVRLEDVEAGDASIRTTSGDISARKLTSPGEVGLQSANGDVSLRDVRCAGLWIQTASGDIELKRGAAGATTIRAASGDVELSALESNPSLGVETASGDIDLDRCIAVETRLSAASGDIELRLEPLPCGYDIAATSVSGDVSLPRPAPAAEGVRQPKISLRTVSGDISARVME